MAFSDVREDKRQYFERDGSRSSIQFLLCYPIYGLSYGINQRIGCISVMLKMLARIISASFRAGSQE